MLVWCKENESPDFNTPHCVAFLTQRDLLVDGRLTNAEINTALWVCTNQYVAHKSRFRFYPVG